MNKIIKVIFLLISASAFSQGMNNVSDTRKLADSMVELFIQKEFQQAIDLAKPHWPLAKVELDVLVNQITGQWPIVDQRFGDAIGSEYVKSEAIGKSFIQYYYLHKFQNHAIYWKISFYKPKDIWVVNNLLFLDKLDPLYSSI